MNYVRFITPWWRVRRHVDCGPFGPAYDAWHDSQLPEVLRVAIGQEIDWFERNLPVPKPRRDAFCVKSRGRWRPDGICWFVAEAREMIAHAFVLASLLGEVGVPVRKVAAECPGTVTGMRHCLGDSAVPVTLSRPVAGRGQAAPRRTVAVPLSGKRGGRAGRLARPLRRQGATIVNPATGRGSTWR
jgi:hypothetical protein